MLFVSDGFDLAYLFDYLFFLLVNACMDGSGIEKKTTRLQG